MAGASESAYDRLRQGILTGELEPGSRLKEEELARTLEVSRTPVREAIRRLHSEGLVEFAPNRGAHVLHWTADDLNEIFSLRAQLEGYAASLAARRITAENLAVLRSLADEMAQIGASSQTDLDDIQRLNALFHGTVLASSGDRRLEAMVSSLTQVALVRRTFHQYQEHELRRSIGHHIEIVEAMSVGEPAWAESIMRAHIFAARASLSRAELPDVRLGAESPV